MLAASILPGQSTQIPNWWFTAEPKAVLSDPLFPTLPLTTRKEILSQLDPKFARMKTEDQNRFLWHTETDYLPKAAAPKQTFRWSAADPNCSSELLQVGWISPTITKRIRAHDLNVQAAFERFSFLRAHVRIENATSEAVLVKPQLFVLDVLKPKRTTLFFEYPSRVYYQFMISALNQGPDYVPTERTTVRSGSTGRAIATIDTPDPVARQDVRNENASAVNSAIGCASTIQSKSLKEELLAPGSSIDGDVWFERNEKVRELVLRIFVSDSAFELPFSLARR